jgi:hypothetical protein
LGRRARVEPGTLIGYLDRRVFPCRLQSNGGAPRAAMPMCVYEGFLDNRQNVLPG